MIKNKLHYVPRPQYTSSNGQSSQFLQKTLRHGSNVTKGGTAPGDTIQGVTP